MENNGGIVALFHALTGRNVTAMEASVTDALGNATRVRWLRSRAMVSRAMTCHPRQTCQSDARRHGKGMQ